MSPSESLSRRIFAAAVLAALSACASTISTNTAPDELVLYAGRPQASLQVQLADAERQQDFTGSPVSVPKPPKPMVPDSEVGARPSAKDGASDALTLHWKNAWLASLRLVAVKPMDLRPYLPDGTVELDLDAVDMARSGLTFAMGCGTDCGRKLRYVMPSRALQGKGWQHLSFPLRCFERDGNDFSAVTQPFVVDSSGSGELAVANVKVVRHGKPNASCVDYRSESTSPTPLAEVWSLDWWMPRHEQKVQQVRQLVAAGRSPKLVFIGDSITHGWENAGQQVWERHFAKYDAVDLGFSGDRTENVLWRLQHGELDGIKPKAVVMMIGTNNTGDRQEDPRTTAAGIKRLLDEIRARLPESKILLLAIFPRDEQPTSRLRQLNDRVNGLISGYADGRQVVFLNINESLANPDGTLSRDVMPDLLHLSDKGYGLWAKSIEPTLQRLLTP
jgi:lysophospholipase L1-like esterase